MAVYSILVHLANDEEHITRWEVARRFAQQHGAHITALFIATPVSTPAPTTGRGASAVYLAAATQSARKKADDLRAEYGRFCEENGIGFDLIVEEGQTLDLLTEHAHAADLIIVSQPKVEHLDDYFRDHIADKLIMVAGVPVMVLPPGPAAAHVGENVLIAWKGTREAVRAVRDALPLLRRASRVLVLGIEPTPEDARSGKQLIRYLERNDITAKMHKLTDAKGDIASVILKNAATHGCDLVVMGAYGKFRLRELITGGVTDHVLKEATIPVFLSH